jgi:hypothetical protein
LRGSQSGAAESGAVETQKHLEAAAIEATSTDSDLARIISAWPRLRSGVKVAIRAIIESADR